MLPTRTALIQVWVLASLYIVGVTLLTRSSASPISDGTMQVLLVLWQVQGGMAAVALPLLLFVIETTRLENPVGGLGAHEVLLRETSLFPILAGAMTATAAVGALLLFAPSNALLLPCALVLILTVVGSVNAFYRALRLTFSRRLLRAATLRLLREKMNHSVRRSALLRIANNLLPDRLAGAGLTYNPFGSGSEPDEVVVFAPISGVITDLDPSRLRKLSELLSRARLRPDAESIASPSILRLNLREIVTSSPLPRWMVRCGDGVKAGKTRLLSLPRDRYVDLDIAEIKRSALNVVTIEDSVDLLSVELGSLRDTAIDAIRQRRTRLLEHHLDVYDVLLRAFADSLKRWEANYDSTSAVKEDTRLLAGGWSELSWIESDILEMATVAIDEDAFDLLRQILDSTYGVALYSVGEQEFYLYRHSLVLLNQLYAQAIRRGQPKLIDQAAERLAFVMGELGTYKVASAAEEAVTEEQVQFVTQAAEALLDSFALLMRAAIDNGRREDFTAFSNAEARATDRIVEEFRDR